ncbi:PLP-dependent transferase, partial [Staphylococcus aureus]|uniref:PLP-dependent transferase n=1 Tax=Staphylococcus aureus TaxID=1280 RepID=UPI00210960E1
RQGYEYSRSANPTRSSVESVIAALENGKHGFAFSSGVAAISAVVMLLDKGDHIILNSDVYGGTYRALTKVFTRFGIEVDFVDTTMIPLQQTEEEEFYTFIGQFYSSNQHILPKDVHVPRNLDKEMIQSVVDT